MNYFPQQRLSFCDAMIIVPDKHILPIIHVSQTRERGFVERNQVVINNGFHLSRTRNVSEVQQYNCITSTMLQSLLKFSQRKTSDVVEV